MLFKSALMTVIQFLRNFVFKPCMVFPSCDRSDKRNVVAIAILAVIFVFYSVLLCCAAAPDAVDEKIKEGIYQYRQENFDEALATFTALRKTYPDNSLVAYYLGLTDKKMENYAEARKELEASLALTPKIKGALIELIDVLYRLDETEEAKKWIGVAEAEGIRPAQAAFLKGLTLLKSGELDPALQAFGNAKDLDASLASAADYHCGIIYLRQKKYDQAKGVFNDLVLGTAGSDVQNFANQYLRQLDEREARERPLHFMARFAFEYDSNVVLRPGGGDFVTQISDSSDTREVWDFQTNYTLKSEDKRKSLKAAYGLRWSKENDLGRYDYLTNYFSLLPSFAFEKILVTFPTNYNHNIVDNKNYLSSINTGNINNIMLTPNNMAQVGVLYAYNDYLRPPYGDENRTGNDVGGTVGWYWFFKDRKAFTNLKYTINQDWTHGNNWEYWGNRFDAGVLCPFWKKFEISVNAQLFAKNFENSHSVFGQKRNDQMYSVSSMLSYALYKGTKLQLQYTYVNTRSNLSLYAYNRNVVGGAILYEY